VKEERAYTEFAENTEVTEKRRSVRVKEFKSARVDE
jgi:hypothetical protein